MEHIETFTLSATTEEVILDALHFLLFQDMMVRPNYLRVEFDPSLQSNNVKVHYSENVMQSVLDATSAVINAYDYNSTVVQAYVLKEAAHGERMKRGREITALISTHNQAKNKDFFLVRDVFTHAAELDLLNMIDAGAFEMAYTRIYEIEKDIAAGNPNPRWDTDDLKFSGDLIMLEIGEMMCTALKAMVDAQP